MNASSQIVSPDRQRFPTNGWYIAAAGEEVGRTLLKRQINHEKMVLFRRTDGLVAALADACPHKGYPFSESKLIGDEVRCGYHGIQFDGAGGCTRIPSQKAIPTSMRARSYPVVEKDMFVWVWTGEPERADPARIPDFGFEARPDFERQLTFSMEVKSNAQFLLENVLDHTHFSYLHAGGFDNDPDLVEGGGEFARAPLQIETTQDMICVRRDFEEMLPSETMTLIFGVPAGKPLNRRLETRSVPASGYLVTREQFWEPSRPDTVVCEAIGLGTVTPIDEDHCLHIAMWSSSYKHHPDLKRSIHDIIYEDVEAVERIHRHYRHNPGAPEISLAADKASILARRMITAAQEMDSAGAKN